MIISIVLGSFVCGGCIIICLRAVKRSVRNGITIMLEYSSYVCLILVNISIKSNINVNIVSICLVS